MLVSSAFENIEWWHNGGNITMAWAIQYTNVFSHISLDQFFQALVHQCSYLLVWITALLLVLLREVPMYHTRAAARGSFVRVSCTWRYISCRSAWQRLSRSPITERPLKTVLDVRQGLPDVSAPDCDPHKLKATIACTVKSPPEPCPWDIHPESRTGREGSLLKWVSDCLESANIFGIFKCVGL